VSLYPKRHLIKININIIPTTEPVVLNHFFHQIYIYIYVLFKFTYPIYVTNPFY
jgi:hypothetical protein